MYIHIIIPSPQWFSLFLKHEIAVLVQKTLALLPPVLVLRKPKPLRLAITGMNAEELHLGRCENC